MIWAGGFLRITAEVPSKSFETKETVYWVGVVKLIILELPNHFYLQDISDRALHLSF